MVERLGNLGLPYNLDFVNSRFGRLMRLQKNKKDVLVVLALNEKGQTMMVEKLEELHEELLAM